MAKFSSKNTLASVYVKGFGGIDRTSLTGNPTAALDIKNFRVLEDGSLRKRCGYKLAAVTDGTIRAAWSGKVYGETALFVLADDQLYIINALSTQKYVVGSVETHSGDACFFMLDGKLYLMDGFKIYHCTLSAVAAVEGYVPLYGVDWPQGGSTVINEPINQMSSYIRIRYKTTLSTSTMITTGLSVESVKRAVINGVEYTSGFTVNSTAVILPVSCPTGAIAEICIKLKNSDTGRAALSSCTVAEVYGGNYDTCVYCFGGDDKSRIFRSRYVSGANVVLSRAMVAESTGLYFPVGYDFYVASGGAVVTAISRHYDRLLIYGADDARMSELSKEEYQDIPAMPINTGVGCLNSWGVALCENDPVTVSRDGIYRWTSNTDRRDESNAIKISSPLGDLFDEEFKKNAFVFNWREKNEIWIGSRGDPDGRVFVYNYRTKLWYRFDHIPADSFFSYDGVLGFVYDSAVFLFDESLGRDYYFSGNITASYESVFTDMGRPERDKRIKRCAIVCEGAGVLELELINERGRTCSLEFETDVGGDKIGRYERSMNSGRLSHVKYRLCEIAESRQRIYGLTLMAGK